VENATVVGNGDVEASVNIQSGKTKYVMTFVLENDSDTTVRLCHCDLLISAGFTRSLIENKGMIAPGWCSTFVSSGKLLYLIFV